jgi:phage terminase large subunit-like protein
MTSRILTSSKNSEPARETLGRIEATLCYQYAADALAGRIVVCKRVKQSSRRFMNDLDRSLYDSKYAWTFNVDKAYRPINFIEKFITPTKGDYDKMTLLPWQHFVEGNLYGWVDKRTRYRRFREGVVFVGSGNGKSTLITGDVAYAISKDDERGAEAYCLANSKQQARIIFNGCKDMIDASVLLAKHFRTTTNGIYYDPAKGVFEPRASDSKNIDGLNVHFGVFDEVQDYEDWRLINRIKAKGKKRRQPLFLYVSTLGDVIDGPCIDLYVLGGHILDESGAIAQRAADRMFVYIAEIDEGDEPEDTECWIKANPSLGPLLKLDDLIDEWERCKFVPAERSNFINKQLNVFTSVDELSFLDTKTILANNGTRDLEKLKGAVCYGGFDLSESEDFTSACLEFPLPDNWFLLLEHSWVPLKKVKEDHEKLDWKGLEKAGVLTIVDNSYVEYELILEWFKKMRDLYRIDSIGFDPAKAFMLVQKLREEGFVLNEVRQGELTLTAPLDDLKERFLDGKIAHNNNPMYYWYLGNVKLTKRGANATYLPTKRHKYRKIDGFAAHLNAHTEYLRKHPTYIPEDRKVSTVLKLS